MNVVAEICQILKFMETERIQIGEKNAHNKEKTSKISQNL